MTAKNNEQPRRGYDRLHALDIATGEEKFGDPAVIQSLVRGTGDGADARGLIQFDPKFHLQRPGLLLSNGVVFIAFGSHADRTPSHGWLLAYDARTLQQVAFFNTPPNGSGGAIWQSGGGPAADNNGNIIRNPDQQNWGI